jgi:serine/threonine protein phosphatase PrpC/uncharacterized protein YraI
MTEHFQVESSQLTDRGQKRSSNEDYVGFFEPDNLQELMASGRLYIVADGVGGAASGELASEYAVRKILYDFYNDSAPDLSERLRRAIEATNADIYQHNARRAEGGGMATTLVAALIHGEDLVVANVGDSRGYLVRGDKISQLTRDHSLVAELMREGSISEEEAEAHPRRHVILRSLGMDEHVAVDLHRYTLRANDIVVLCSDGLTRYVSDEELARTVAEHSPQQATHRLVDMANVRGGKDNISVSVIKIGEPLSTETLTGEGGGGSPLSEDDLAETIPRSSLASLRRAGNWLIGGWLIGGMVALFLLAVASAFGACSPLQTIGSSAFRPLQPTSSPSLPRAEGPAITDTPTAIPTFTPMPTYTPLPPAAFPTLLPTSAPTDTLFTSPLPSPTSSPAATPIATVKPAVTPVRPFTVAVDATPYAVARSGPGTDYPIVTRLAGGTAITVTGAATNAAEEKWYQVNWPGQRDPAQESWIASWLVAKAGRPAITPLGPFTTTVDATPNAIIRSGPGKDYEEITRLAGGTAITVTGAVTNTAEEKWYQVNWPGQRDPAQESWIASWLVARR